MINNNNIQGYAITGLIYPSPLQFHGTQTIYIRAQPAPLWGV